PSPTLFRSDRERLLHPVHAEDHDLGRGRAHAVRPRIPGVDLLGVPQTTAGRRHPRWGWPAEGGTRRPAPEELVAKPLDPRLLRRASSARRTIGYTVVLSIAVTATVVAIALTLAQVLGDLVTGARQVSQTSGQIAIIAGLFALRGLLQVALGRIGHIGAREVIAQLRAQVLTHMSRLGPRWAADNASRTGTLLTRGLDALDPYFTAYLP